MGRGRHEELKAALGAAFIAVLCVGLWVLFTVWALTA